MALIPGKHEKLFTVGINVSKPEYNGDLGNTMFKPTKSSFWNYWGVGSTFSINLSPSFDLGINGNIGNYGYYLNKDYNFISKKLDLSALINYKLDNGYILNRESLFSPFLTTGIGYANYSMSNVQKRNELGEENFKERFERGDDLILPVGAGVQVKFNKTWGLRYQYLYYFTFDDKHDKSIVKNSPNDKFGQHLISVLYSFGNIVRKDNCRCDY